MSDTDRLNVIRQVYLVLFREAESFHNRAGGNLAYLLRGIATSATMDFSQPQDREFVDCLRRWFPEQHPVWQFVAMVPEPHA